MVRYNKIIGASFAIDCDRFEKTGNGVLFPTNFYSIVKMKDQGVRLKAKGHGQQ